MYTQTQIILFASYCFVCNIQHTPDDIYNRKIPFGEFQVIPSVIRARLLAVFCGNSIVYIRSDSVMLHVAKLIIESLILQAESYR